jgi:hypothetical protein
MSVAVGLQPAKVGHMVRRASASACMRPASGWPCPGAIDLIGHDPTQAAGQIGSEGMGSDPRHAPRVENR